MHISTVLLIALFAISLKERNTKDELDSFPGHGRNGLATSVSSNCYFRYQKFKVGSTDQISETDNYVQLMNGWLL